MIVVLVRQENKIKKSEKILLGIAFFKYGHFKSNYLFVEELDNLFVLSTIFCKLPERVEKSVRNKISFLPLKLQPSNNLILFFFYKIVIVVV